MSGEKPSIRIDCLWILAEKLHEGLGGVVFAKPILDESEDVALILDFNLRSVSTGLDLLIGGKCADRRKKDGGECACCE